MDIMLGLSAASQALGIAKDLKEIAKRSSDAETQLKIAELIESLANVKIALSEARGENQSLTEKIGRLERELEAATNGERCPICSQGIMKVISERPHPEFRFAGVKIRDRRCSGCNHKDEQFYDPTGVTSGSR